MWHDSCVAITITDPIDWLRDASGDVVVPIQHVAGLAAVAQGIDQAIRLVRGEWFLDRTAGVPYIANDFVSSREALLAHTFDAARWRAEMRRAILSVSTVARIDSIECAFDSDTRTASITWQVATVFGGVVAGTTETVAP